MDPVDLSALLLVAGAAAYVQTITGFAFGLVMMGVVGVFGLLPLPDAAVIVGILTLTNATQMLIKGWRQVARRELALTLLGSLPMLGVGYALLNWLADTRIDGLKLALGLVIMASSLQLALKPEPLARRSSDGSFLAVGVVSGLLGGLFSTGGPPLIYHLYRQPFPIPAIRETLVTAFGIAAFVRLGFVVEAGNMPAEAVPALLGVPIVMAATTAARRWPPPLPPKVLRRVVFLLLFLAGVSMAVPAALNLIGLLA